MIIVIIFETAETSPTVFNYNSLVCLASEFLQFLDSLDYPDYRRHVLRIGGIVFYTSKQKYFILDNFVICFYYLTDRSVNIEDAMEFVISFLNTVLPILYFVSTYLYGMFFFRNDDLASKYMSTVLKITVSIHLLDIVLRSWYFSHFPLASVFEAVSVIALAAALIYLYLEFRLKVRTTGYFILVLIFFMQLFSSAFINFTHHIPEILHSPLFVFHTGAAILGYAGFAISFIYSLMYLLLFHDIKSSKFSVIYNRLPSLEVLAGLNYNSAAIGFSFLSVAIIFGSVWSNKVFGEFFSRDPKILVAYLTWVIYGLELLGGNILRWSRRRLAFLSLTGFTIIIFSIVAVNLFLSSFHAFK